jgi:hypothetical protein
VKKDFLSACTVALIEVNCLFSELAVTSSVASSATRVYFPGPGAHKTTKTQQNNTKQNTQKQKTKKQTKHKQTKQTNKYYRCGRSFSTVRGTAPYRLKRER